MASDDTTLTADGEKPAPAFTSCDPKTICAPVSGTIVPLASVADPVFAGGMLGQGIGVQANGGIVFSPVTGTVTAIVDSKHAVAIHAESGAEVLVHVGIDTVCLRGSGFRLFVEKNQHVSAGEPLIGFDHDLIRAKNLDDTVIVTVTNSADFSSVRPSCGDEVDLGAPLLSVER